MPNDTEIMDLFPHLYEGYQPKGKTVVADVPIEIDDELGLEVVQKPTMEAKYNLSNLKDNSFVRSLREQFDRKGYLSEKQVQCLR